jgi:hypothetical protein
MMTLVGVRQSRMRITGATSHISCMRWEHVYSNLQLIKSRPSFFTINTTTVESLSHAVPCANLAPWSFLRDLCCTFWSRWASSRFFCTCMKMVQRSDCRLSWSGWGWCLIAWSYLDQDEEILKDKLYCTFLLQRAFCMVHGGVWLWQLGPCWAHYGTVLSGSLCDCESGGP